METVNGWGGGINHLCGLRVSGEWCGSAGIGLGIRGGVLNGGALLEHFLLPTNTEYDIRIVVFLPTGHNDPNSCACTIDKCARNNVSAPCTS